MRRGEEQIRLLGALDEALHLVHVGMAAQTEMGTPQVRTRIVDDLRDDKKNILISLDAPKKQWPQYRAQ